MNHSLEVALFLLHFSRTTTTRDKLFTCKGSSAHRYLAHLEPRLSPKTMKGLRRPAGVPRSEENAHPYGLVPLVGAYSPEQDTPVLKVLGGAPPWEQGKGVAQN